MPIKDKKLRKIVTDSVPIAEAGGTGNIELLTLEFYHSFWRLFQRGISIYTQGGSNMTGTDCV
jgi:hypothetical protein